MMNCLEFRRHCLAEPGSQDSEFLRHKRECTRCADYAADIGQLDRKLEEALHVNVPANLASRIILRQSIERDRSRKRQRVRWYALAASVLFAVGIGTGLVVKTWTQPFDGIVVAHLNAEREFLLTKQDVSNDILASVLRTVGAELRGNLSQLRHVSFCYLSKEPGAHLVFDGRQGPVIVLLLPKQRIADPMPIHSERFRGIMVPTNNGSMAIVGEQGENLSEIEQKLRSNLTWRL